MTEKKNKGWNNITPGGFEKMDKERLREVSRKGAARMLEVKREKRTAKKCLEDILSLEASEGIITKAELPPELAEQLKGYVGKITMYDLVHLVTVGQAIGGNMRAAEYIRDTYGDMPVKQVSVEGVDIMTEADRRLMEKVNARFKKQELEQQEREKLIVSDVAPTEAPAGENPAGGNTGTDSGEESGGYFIPEKGQA